MKVAVAGCAHGEIEKIFDAIQNKEKNEGIKVNFLLCCGDFESCRNLQDLRTMAGPSKYRQIGTFYKYYSGEKVAPVLTIFVGGNHEASNYLQELPYGGWVAPNIYYLGYAGVVQVNGLRIGGMSGIYKHDDFRRGHHEFPPYDWTTMKSVYYQRNLEVFRLNQLSGDIDIMISHDWPNTVAYYGNVQQLCTFNPNFRPQIEGNHVFGSPACEKIMFAIKPTYWFAAHMHCKFLALIPHDRDGNKTTKFLALDKCLPERKFLQVLDINGAELVNEEEIRFEYDLEWLTILSITNHLLSVKTSRGDMPRRGGTDRCEFTPTNDEMDRVRKKFSNDLEIPKNFCRTVEAHNPTDESKNAYRYQPNPFINPQNTTFCDTLGIDDPLSLAMALNGYKLNYSSALNSGNGEKLESSSVFDSKDQATSSGQNSSLASALPKT